MLAKPGPTASMKQGRETFSVDAVCDYSEMPNNSAGQQGGGLRLYYNWKMDTRTCSPDISSQDTASDLILQLHNKTVFQIGHHTLPQ